MGKEDSINLEEKSKFIVEDIRNNLSLSEDEKMLSIVLEMGKILSKSVDFFYDSDSDKQRMMYENYEIIENMQVICKSVVFLYKKMGDELGLKCTPIEMDKDDAVKFNHWSLVYENSRGSRYLINPIPDFYRIQLGFSLKAFCQYETYYGYDGMPFNVMEDSYIKEMCEKIGYLKGNMYTDELFEKLSTELNCKIGTHIVRTSDIYQDYYLKLLNFIDDETKTEKEKLKELEEIDDNFDNHKDILIKSIRENKIDYSVIKIIHETAFKKLLNSEVNLDTEREGANYAGQFDITKMKQLQDEILIYKYKYMMKTIPFFTEPLTGYIENKNFMDNLIKYIFRNASDRERIYRHTVYKEEGNKKEYYMMYSVSLGDGSSLYSFYNQKTKECKIGIEPVQYMLENKLKPLDNSSLKKEILGMMDSSKFISSINDMKISENRVGKIA